MHYFMFILAFWGTTQSDPILYMEVGMATIQGSHPSYENPGSVFNVHHSYERDDTISQIQIMIIVTIMKQ